MSIITDALNRLQAERARQPGQPWAPAALEPVEAADFRDPDVSSPHFLAGSYRNRLPFLVVVLGGVAIAVYLWGLPLIAAPDKVTPEQGTVKEANPAQPVPSRIVKTIPGQGEEPVAVTVAEAEESEAPKPAEAASASHPPAKTTSSAAKDGPARKPRSSPGVRSTAEPLAARKVDSAFFHQRRNQVPSLLRNATPFQVRLARAQMFIKKRQYERAVSVLQPLFVRPPERWEPWFWLGTAQLGLGQWEKAQASLVEGLARDATVPQLWVQRALVSQHQGRFGEALDALRQAELLAPQLPEVHLNLAYALDVEGDRLLAVKHYRTFLALTEGKKAYRDTRKKVLEHISRLSQT